MNCSACDDLLIRRSIEALSADETARLDRHLEACAACRQRASGNAALLGALDALREDIHAAEPTFVFRPAAPPGPVRPARSVAISLMRAGLAMAAVLAMVVLVWHRDAGDSQPAAEPLAAQRTARSAPAPVIRTARVVPWLDEGRRPRFTRLRGRIRLTVPAYVPGISLSASKTPSILIRPRRTHDVDRNQDSRSLGGDQPVGAGARNRRDARV